jgi:hypothetical protein
MGKMYGQPGFRKGRSNTERNSDVVTLLFGLLKARIRSARKEYRRNKFLHPSHNQSGVKFHPNSEVIDIFQLIRERF